MNSFESETQQEVWQTLRELNDCWTKGDGSGLENYFHERMVAITPVDRNRREGRKACIEGWLGFVKMARILYWNEVDPQIQVYGDTAIVTYYFDMAFMVGDQRVESSGRDMFTFIKENGKWWAVADQFSLYP